MKSVEHTRNPFVHRLCTIADYFVRAMAPYTPTGSGALGTGQAGAVGRNGRLRQAFVAMSDSGVDNRPDYDGCSITMPPLSGYESQTGPA